jgi:hypothetical protein
MYSAWPPGIAAGDVRVAEQAGRGVAEEGLGQVGVAVGHLADRIVAGLALLALAADHLERHDHPIADLEALGLGLGADLDDLAHRLVSHDVANAHRRDEAVHQVQIGPADAGRGDADDRVLGILDDGIGHFLAAQVLLALPADRLHGPLLFAIALDGGHPHGGDDVQGGDGQHHAEGEAGVAALGIARPGQAAQNGDVEHIAGHPRPQALALVGSENRAMPVAISRAPNRTWVVWGVPLRPRKRFTPFGASNPQRPSPRAFWPSMNDIWGVTAGLARTRSVARVMVLPPGSLNVLV